MTLMDLSILGDEIIVSVGFFLGPSDLLNLALSCRRFGAKLQESFDSDGTLSSVAEVPIPENGKHETATDENEELKSKQAEESNDLYEAKIKTLATNTNQNLSLNSQPKTDAEHSNLSLIEESARQIVTTSKEPWIPIFYRLEQRGKNWKENMRRKKLDAFQTLYSSYTNSFMTGMNEAVDAKTEARIGAEVDQQWEKIEHKFFLKIKSSLSESLFARPLSRLEDESWMGTYHRMARLIEERDAKFKKWGMR